MKQKATIFFSLLLNSFISGKKKRKYYYPCSTLIFFICMYLAFLFLGLSIK